MYVNKSARPVAPAGGAMAIDQARTPDESGLGASARSQVVSRIDAESSRSQDVPSNQEARRDGAPSKLLLMKSATQRRQYAYLVSYARLRELLGFVPEGDQAVVLDQDRLQQATRMLLRAVHVDEDWYGKQYPDVKEAIAKGVFRSAKHHFIQSGYFEGRRPAPVLVDEEWYARAYPDVGESVEFGELSSCQEHFDRYGEAEGRLPAED